MNRIIISIITLSIMASTFSQSVLAAKPSPRPTREEKLEKNDRKEVKSSEKTQLKVTKANAEIDRRIKSMNHLLDLINAAKRITNIQKEALVKQIQAEITDLTALKTKINAETDTKALLEEKKSIMSSYRIYALFMPKINIIAHADRIINLGEIMKKKTSSSAALAKISNSQKVANEAIDLVMKLEPTGWPANKSELVKAKDMLKIARKDLVEAWKLAKLEKKTSPEPEVSEAPKVSPTPTLVPTVSPTTSPTATPTPLPTI